MPLNRIFIILNDICLKSLSYLNTNKYLFKSLFELIISLLKPLDSGNSNLEITSLEWLLLFLSRLLSYIDKTRLFLNNNNNNNGSSFTDGKGNGEYSNRWEFLENIYNKYNNYNNNNNSKGKLTNTLRNQYPQTHLSQQQQQQQAANFNKNKTKKKLLQTNKYFLFNKIKESRKLNLYDLKYQRKMNEKSSNCYFSSNERHLLNQLNKKSFSFIQLPRDLTLILCKLLVKLLINSNSYSNSDLFVLTCRIVSSLCLNTIPTISLSEIITLNELSKILLICVGIAFNHASASWGSPWSPHAVLCFLMDLIENEKYVTIDKDKEQQQQASVINVDESSMNSNNNNEEKFSINSLIKSTVNTDLI